MGSLGQRSAWLGAWVGAAMGLALLAASGSAAPESMHLTFGAWRGLNRLYSKGPPSTVRGCAKRAGEPSADPEVGGVQGLCIDEVEVADWIDRFVRGCLGIQEGGPGATEASCRADIAGVDSSAAASAAWDGWFAARLGAGGCRTIFSLQAVSARRLAAAGRPLVHALGSPTSSNTALNRALHEWLSALHSGDHETPAQKRTVRAEFDACRPPGG